MAFLADLEAWLCHKYGLTRDYFWNVGTIRERHRLKVPHARLPTKVHFMNVVVRPPQPLLETPTRYAIVTSNIKEDNMVTNNCRVFRFKLFCSLLG